MEDIVKEAKETGYVETLFHRRRYLPDIHNRNFNLRSFAERTAINSPIQGTAADIIKVAMVRMDKVLKEKGLQANMLLQVHDELIFECPEEEIPVLEKLVPEIMEHAVDLAVPRSPRINTPPMRGSTAFSTRARFMRSCPTMAVNGKIGRIESPLFSSSRFGRATSNEL